MVVPLSVLLLGESLTPGLLGIALVVVGIVAAHLPDRRAATSFPPHANARAVVLALLTGLAISGYSFVNTLGVQRVPVPLYATLVFAVDAVWSHAPARCTDAVATLRGPRRRHADRRRR